MSNNPELPYLLPDQRVRFPHPSTADEEGVVAVGGNLSPGFLLSAYEQGIFPWYEDGLPLLWWSPDPRFVLYPENLHIPRRIRRVIRNGRFSVSFDARFDEVISLCSRVPRRGQQGTWITDAMLRSYQELHELGFAHSVEVYRDGHLVGGLYGLLLGRVFCGESMFSLERDASKAGFVHLMLRAASPESPLNLHLIDSQMETQHMKAFGAECIPRTAFLNLVSTLLVAEPAADAWRMLNRIATVFSN